MPWVGTTGSILKQDRKLARLSEWQFVPDKPYVADDDLAYEVTSRLVGGNGHFIVDGGPSPRLADEIRNRRQLTIRCEIGPGTISAQVTVDAGLLSLPGTVAELFPFRVTGDVGFCFRSTQG